MGIINAGTAVGAVAAPPLIARFSATPTGAGFSFSPVRSVSSGSWWHLSYASTRPLTSNFADPSPDSAANLPWIHLFRIRETWGLVTAKFLSDAAWFFYLFWLPKYLYDARGFDMKAVGTFAWMPSAAAGVGCLLGGGFSSYLVRRKFSLGVARKWRLD